MHKVDIDNRTIFRFLFGVAAFLLLAWVCILLSRELAWVGAAFFLAIALNPLVDWISQKTRVRNRGLSVGLVFTVFFVFVVVISLSLVPPLYRQTVALIGNVPTYVEQVQTSNTALGQYVRDNHLVDKAKDAEEQILKDLTGSGGTVIGVVKNVFSGVAAFVTVMALTFFMLLEGHNWVRNFWSVYPPKRRKRYQNVAAQMYAAVSGYVTGNLLTSLIATILASVMLMIVGVPYAIPLGIIVGVFDLLPLIGASIGAAIVVIVALFTSTTAGLIMLIFFIIYQQIENHVLQPIVYGKTIKMSPLLVLVAAILGASLGGVLGTIVAIPIAASLKILITDYIRHDAALPRD